jgi:hypothetical protein
MKRWLMTTLKVKQWTQLNHRFRVIKNCLRTLISRGIPFTSSTIGLSTIMSWTPTRFLMRISSLMRTWFALAAWRCYHKGASPFSTISMKGAEKYVRKVLLINSGTPLTANHEMCVASSRFKKALSHSSWNHQVIIRSFATFLRTTRWKSTQMF